VPYVADDGPSQDSTPSASGLDNRSLVSFAGDQRGLAKRRRAVKVRPLGPGPLASNQAKFVSLAPAQIGPCWRQEVSITPSPYWKALLWKAKEMFRNHPSEGESQPLDVRFTDPSVPSRSCCCPARPVVKVIMPPTATRRRYVDLWLCGHHYRASLAALLAAGATVEDLTVYVSLARGGRAAVPTQGARPL
jgi:hypothetical protein